MTATSQPTLDTLPDMHNVAAIIAQDARENQAGVDVISVGWPSPKLDRIVADMVRNRGLN
jgi:hypothetical protein